MRRRHLHPLPTGARLSSPTRPDYLGLSCPTPHSISGRASNRPTQTVRRDGPTPAELSPSDQPEHGQCRGSAAGRQSTQSSTRNRSCTTGVCRGFRRAYARIWLLSVLRYFLRKQGMRDLGLPAAVPVVVLPLLVANVVRYQVLFAVAWVVVTACAPTWAKLASLGCFALRRGDRKWRAGCGCERVGVRDGGRAAEAPFWRVFRSTPVALCCL